MPLPHGRRLAVSERPTPETDKIAKSLLYEKADKRDYELRQHARRLERERDDLKDQLATAMMSIRLQQRREQQTNEQP